MNEIPHLLFALVLGLALLYYGACWLVRGGTAIAARTCVSPLIVGLTLVAFGTSAPELFVSVGAAGAGLGDICIGNVVGSNIFNILVILGVSALVRPVAVVDMDAVDFAVMIVLAAALWPMMKVRGRLGRTEGVLLLLFYALYVTWLFASRK